MRLIFTLHLHYNCVYFTQCHASLGLKRARNIISVKASVSKDQLIIIIDAIMTLMVDRGRFAMV